MNDTNNPGDGCQLQVVYESGGAPSLYDKVRSNFMRIKSALRRRIPTFRTGFAQDAGKDPSFESGSSVSGPGGKQRRPCLTFKPGDFVEVLSMDEIRSTLDAYGKCGGLAFMPGMGRFAGKRFTVLKGVRTMFDERAWKMVKLKGTYILSDVICDGRDMFDKEGCDRCCFYFWKERWLRKVEKP